MKQGITRGFFILVSLLGFSLPLSAQTPSPGTTSTTGSTGTIVTWITDNTPGGHYINGGGTGFHPEKPGVEIELYRMVGVKLGLDIRFRRLPWNLCLKQIQHNKVDGVFPASFKPGRTKIGVYPMKNGRVDPGRRTRNNAYYLYTLKSEALATRIWDTIHDIKQSGAFDDLVIKYMQ